MKDLNQRLKKLEIANKSKLKFNEIETFYYKDGHIEYVNELDALHKVVMEYEEIDHIEPSYPLLNAFLGGNKE